jgi:hypothetical protein
VKSATDLVSLDTTAQTGVNAASKALSSAENLAMTGEEAVAAWEKVNIAGAAIGGAMADINYLNGKISGAHATYK